MLYYAAVLWVVYVQGRLASAIVRTTARSEREAHSESERLGDFARFFRQHGEPGKSEVGLTIDP